MFRSVVDLQLVFGFRNDFILAVENEPDALDSVLHKFQLRLLLQQVCLQNYFINLSVRIKGLPFDQ